MVATTSIAVYQQSMLGSCQPEVYTKRRRNSQIHGKLEILAEMETKTDMRFMN